MKLHNLPKTGGRRKAKRLGCGRGSGHGKTSSRGHKGGKARSGYTVRSNYSGIPLYRRFPKRGFSRGRFRRPLEEVNVSDLERVFSSETSDIVGNESFWEAGLIRDKNSDVKILGRGKLTKPLTVKAHRFSASARAKIEEVGGKTVS